MLDLRPLERRSQAWAQEFGRLPNLEQLARDGGTALTKGVALVNQERAQQGRELLLDQGDHFHAFWGGGVGVRKAATRARHALAKAEAADKALAESRREGHKQTAAAVRASHAWKQAE
ncbi:MAG: hypothetical protein HY040_28905 [Planctomycetes bacterium]|nr:hypothetical protein [Planctomycetota bacterium]